MTPGTDGASLAAIDIFDTDLNYQFFRVTPLGDVPTGPDGSLSVAVSGAPHRTGLTSEAIAGCDALALGSGRR